MAWFGNKLDDGIDDRISLARYGNEGNAPIGRELL